MKWLGVNNVYLGHKKLINLLVDEFFISLLMVNCKLAVLNYIYAFFQTFFPVRNDYSKGGL
jgi:hypothetical protein